jgi:UDP-N-acetylmuramoyl-tripeptide--D-alanyl-D-alanine ligase
MRATLQQCCQWVAGATLVNARMTADTAFDGVTTDSRTAAAGSLFVALKGEKFDAHRFLADVAQRGVAAVVVDRTTDAANLAGLTLPTLLVPDTRVALGQIASGWRRQFSLPVIGVTGSNGKTTVKEMIAAILAEGVGAQHCMATRGNFNNDIGVPLTLMRLTADMQAAVVELGMNHPGEIALLTAMAQPTVGLVNNAQREHQEFMASVDAVAAENGAVIAGLPADGVAVFPADEPYADLWRGMAQASGSRRCLRFGLVPDADVRCSWVPNAFGSDLLVTADITALGTATAFSPAVNTFAVRLSAAGEHNVRNALAAIACSLAIGMSVEAIVRGLENFAPVAGRLQRKQAWSGALVIDDTYNANPDSVRAAIDVLAQCAAPRVLVLGDMGEVGDEGAAFHAEIGAHARARGITQVLTLGDLAVATSTAFGSGARHFDDIGALLEGVDPLATPDAALLIKGSRFMKMERVVNHLVALPAAPLSQHVQDAH